jgi:hypothetical protein
MFLSLCEDRAVVAEKEVRWTPRLCLKWRQRQYLMGAIGSIESDVGPQAFNSLGFISPKLMEKPIKIWRETIHRGFTI